jgi:small subunit ribosomal protein S20
MLRKDARRRQRNIAEKSRVKTLVKKVRAAVSENNADEAVSRVRMAISALDTAAKKRVIHPRNAARKKSRLMHLINKMQQTTETAPEA